MTGSLIDQAICSNNELPNNNTGDSDNPVWVHIGEEDRSLIVERDIQA